MKYPRTYHLSFSPEIHSDDKVIDINCEENLLSQDIVILEKLDGGNACLKNGKVFARTHSSEANHQSFSMLKQINQCLSEKIGNFEIYGENLQGIHSIDYGLIESPFYIFNIVESDIFLSWDDNINLSKSFGLQTVPEVFRGKMNSLEELKQFLIERLGSKSGINDKAEIEGFVIRPLGSFKRDEFSCKVAKFVRNGHVQTDEHWSKNWKECELNNNFWSEFYGKL